MKILENLLKKHFLLFYFFLFQLSSLWTTEGINIFCSTTDTTKRIRIIHYDIAKQKLKSVYDIASNNDTELAQKISEFTIPHLTLSITGDVVLAADFSSTTYMVRTTGNIDIAALPADLDEDGHSNYRVYDRDEFTAIYDKRYKHLYRTRDMMLAEDICEQLKPIKKKMAQEADFPIQKFPGAAITLAGLPNGDLGFIGETITELTMLSFGYDQLDSKYEDNHGIDGVFIDRSHDKECFITESKCWGQNKTASTTLKKLLSEAEIWRKIQIGIEKVGNIKESMRFLEGFIIDNPGSVYKFAHRTLLCGSSQSAFDLIDYDEFSRLSGRITVNILAEQLAKLSQEDIAKLKGLVPEIFT